MGKHFPILIHFSFFPKFLIKFSILSDLRDERQGGKVEMIKS